jgi:hypothetical protein
MNKLVFIAAMLAAAGQAPAQESADVRLLGVLPGDTTSVTTYYGQNVYDPTDQKLGDVADLLVDKDGLIPVTIISVGGFLGLTSKFVAIPFNGLQVKEKEHKPYLVLETTKKALKEAPAFRYNRSTRLWERVED